MFHVVYSRDYWNHDEPGQFTNTWTIYRNVSYFKLREMQKAIPSLLKNADEVYSEYMAKNNPKVSNDNFIFKLKTKLWHSHLQLNLKWNLIKLSILGHKKRLIGSLYM